MGGVTKPMARFTHMMMPKWMGSTPMASATGSSTGVNTRIAGPVSMIMPTNSNSTLISSRITTLEEMALSTASLTMVATFISVITRAKATAADRMMRMGA